MAELSDGNFVEVPPQVNGADAASSTSPPGWGAKPRRDFHWLTDEDVQVPILEGSWTIKHVIPSRGLGVIFGRPGSGKSFVALDLALRVATGLAWHDRKVIAGAAVYISMEGGKQASINRMYAWAQQTGQRTFPRFRLSPEVLDLRSSDEDVIALLQDIEAWLTKTGYKLHIIVVDTLNRAFGGGNENLAEDMGEFIRQCGQLAEKLDCFVLIVHHSGKDEAKGSRGHSSLLGAIDTELEADRPKAAKVDDESAEMRGVLHLQKQRNGRDGLKFGYELVEVDLGDDVDGEPVTTLVAVRADAAEVLKARKNVKKPQGKNQKTLIEVIRQMTIDERGTPSRGQNGFPSSPKVLLLDQGEVLTEAMRRNPDGRTDNLKRALTALIEIELVIALDDKVWLP